MTTDKEAIVIKLIENYLDQHDTLVSTKDFLLNMIHLLKEDNPEVEVTTKPKERIVLISCDASITVNPGGEASIGAVIEYDQWDKPMTIARAVNAKTNNQAEYDAIYTGLVSFFNIVNNPGCNVTVRSDSQLVVKQLNKEIECIDKQLLKRRDAILEFAEKLPVHVAVEWLPRNSTPELRQANFLAQDLLGVPRH